MYVALLILHLLVCLGLVSVVLLQSGKGGGLAGGAFGGSAQTVFGGRGATDFITRATMILGTTFFVTSLVLALMSSGFGRSNRSLIQGQARQSTTSGPGQVPQSLPPSTGSAPAPASGQGVPAPAGQATPAQGTPAPASETTPATPQGGGR